MRFGTVGLVILAAATQVAAQEVVYVREAPAWLGISYDVRWVLEDGTCTPLTVVEGVIQGSPAERAGLRPGDAIIAVNGEPAPGDRLQTISARLAPGDSVRLALRREGGTREVTAVADRRPDRPPHMITDGSAAYRSSGVPIVEVRGDTLVAWNLGQATNVARVSYWVRRADGRAEYRRVQGTAGSELDRRVASLIACADSARARYVWSDEVTPLSLRRLQARADSLRAIMTERALERRQAEGYVTVLPSPSSSDGERGVTIRFATPDGGFSVLRAEDHVALGLRGVAGAELTALEPELAAYFRNAERGLLVLRTAPDTPADRAGLRPGDVVIAAGGRRLESVDELRRILSVPSPMAVELQVVRQGRTRTLTLPRD